MRYKSNVDSVISKLKARLSPDKMDLLYLELAQNMYASNLRRVHNDGKGVNNSPIGKYSSNPLYVNPVRAGVRKFPLVGKTGKSKFKDGRPHKSRYFNNGYGGFKRQIGFGAKVNMQVTGRLKTDFALLKSGKGYVIGFRSKYGKDVSEGNEHRFNKKIWGISQQDKKINEQIVKRHFANA